MCRRITVTDPISDIYDNINSGRLILDIAIPVTKLTLNGYNLISKYTGAFSSVRCPYDVSLNITSPVTENCLIECKYIKFKHLNTKVYINSLYIIICKFTGTQPSIGPLIKQLYINAKTPTQFHVPAHIPFIHVSKHITLTWEPRKLKYIASIHGVDQIAQDNIARLPKNLDEVSVHYTLLNLIKTDTLVCLDFVDDNLVPTTIFAHPNVTRLCVNEIGNNTILVCLTIVSDSIKSIVLEDADTINLRLSQSNGEILILDTLVVNWEKNIRKDLLLMIPCRNFICKGGNYELLETGFPDTKMTFYVINTIKWRRI